MDLRPSVLIVEPDAGRRRGLARGLAARGYEVVPAISAEEGRRFAAALGPALFVVLAETALAAGEAPPSGFLPAPDGHQRHLLVLRGGRRAGAEAEEAGFHELVVEGLTEGDLLRRLRLVLLGFELDVEPDGQLETLVGDLELVPFLELVRGLGRSRADVRVDLGAAAGLELRGGEVVTAHAEPVRGVKAFHRLARRRAGLFRISLDDEPREAEIAEDIRSLIISAIEDNQGELPDLAARLGVEMGPGFFGARFTPLEQKILELANQGAVVGQILDALTVTDGVVLEEISRLRAMGVLSWREGPGRVRVVTDSTADLPEQLARDHRLYIVPLTVTFGERVFRDRVDLQPRGFYSLLEEGEAMPVTQPASVRQFAELYRDALHGNDLLSVHLSGMLSATVEHARTAADQALPAGARRGRPRGRGRVEVVDSGQVGLGLGLAALLAARLAARGGTLEEIVRHLDRMLPRVRTLFMVDTLEYLVRGGRIGRVRALMGEMMGIRPILGLMDGVVAPVDRVRGARAALPRLAELACQGLAPERPVIVGVAHAKSPTRADQLRRLIEQRVEVGELIVGEMGPAVGTHAGPGCVGVACFQPTAEEWPRVAAEETGGSP